MSHLDFEELRRRSGVIRAKYHELEVEHHGTHWTVTEDALAFLTDAALVGRLTMANQNRWPKEVEAGEELMHKLGESIWWLTSLATRMDIDIEDAVVNFMAKTEKVLDIEAGDKIAGSSHSKEAPR